MGIFAEALSPRASIPAAGADPLSNFWYTSDPSGYVMERGLGGIGLNADTLLKCGTVFAAVGFRGDSWAMCPPSTYRKTSTGRQEEPNHPSQVVLRNPNPWMTGNRWRHLNGVWMALWGNAYNEMREGDRSFADELWPMEPWLTEVVDKRRDGTLVYRYRPIGEPERILGQEKVLHFRDLSTDGIKGVPMYRLIRNVVGIHLLAEQHLSTFLQKGSRISGLLVPDKPLDPDQRKVLRESVNKDLGGPVNTGTFGIMPSGVKVEKIDSTHRDAQFVELSDAIVGSILRFLRVPGVIVGWADKTATYASAEAFFEKGGIKHCVLPILFNVEAEEEKALLMPGDSRQIKHNLDALERANLKDRTDALVKAIGGPFMAVNEGRTIEDLPRLDDPRYDEVLTPVNMDPDGEPDEPAPPPFAPGPPQPPAKPEEDDPEAKRIRERAERHATTLARQIVNREQAAIHGSNGGLGAARRYAKDADGWEKWVEDYYEKHAAHVTRVLHVSEESARAYCEGQRIALLAEGPAITEKWESENVPRLVALALGENE